MVPKASLQSLNRLLHAGNTRLDLWPLGLGLLLLPQLALRLQVRPQKVRIGRELNASVWPLKIKDNNPIARGLQRIAVNAKNPEWVTNRNRRKLAVRTKPSVYYSSPTNVALHSIPPR